MMGYFGLTVELAHTHTSYLDGSDLNRLSAKEFRDYLKIKQYRDHNPLAYQG